MASLIPGYNYDIFISYRQKDNKHDGWVTEFVDNLKGELESTFKEEVGVYFDINPHDGLLETHDVDESLKNKLKCLVFIPIISRTYCDPKAFAWEHEFKAFIEQASRDQFGLKVKVPGGNVASRVLPVRIYDLDTTDIKLCESVLGGVLRSVDFIYKSAGVNRPLLLKEENPQDNLNYSNYRDQINKVANSIKEIITGIRQHTQKPDEISREVSEPLPVTRKNNKAKFITGSVLALLLIILGIMFIPKLFQPEMEIEKSIAVLPFKYLSDEPDKQYLADGMMEAVLLHLSKIRDIRVLGSTSVEQYRQTTKTIQTIGKELNVEYVLEGNFQKYGDNARLIVQLIRTEKESHIWSNEYNRNWNDILLVQSEVAKAIASELHAVITPEEEMIIDATPTTDLTAYDFYLRGNDYQKRSYREEDIRYAIQMYQKAVEIDPGFTLAWVGLAACSRTLFWFSHDKSEENLSRTKEYLDKAQALSPTLKEVQFEEALYHYHCRRDYSKSLQLLEKLKNEYPEDAAIYLWIGYVYRRMGEFRKSLDYNDHAISLDPSSSWDKWSNASTTLLVLHNYKDAEKYLKKAIDLNPSNQDLYIQFINFCINTGQIKKAKEFLTDHEKYIDPQALKQIKARLEFLVRNYDEAVLITQSLTEIEFSSQSTYDTRHLQLGLMYRAIPDNTMAKRNFTIARDTILNKINKSKNDERLYMALGIACAGLGNKEEALEAGKKALEILDFANDALGGYNPEMNMVRILVMTGDYDEAMIRLDKIIKHPGLQTVEILKLDPFWDPVRNNTIFKDIVNNPEYQVNLSL